MVRLPDSWPFSLSASSLPENPLPTPSAGVRMRPAMLAYALKRLDDLSARDTVNPRPAAPGVAVTLRGLAKAFGEPTVLLGLDLHIPAGQFVAIVGQSGCGKSTLLRLITGLEEPRRGRRWLGERPDASAGACRIMFQEPRLLPWARVVDNVAVGLEREGSRLERLERAREALDQVG